MVDHARRFTARKIGKRIALIGGMVHRRAEAIAPFRWTRLADARTAPPLGADVSGWPEIAPHSYWAGQDVHFLLATDVTVPPGWGADGPVALHLPLGVAGDIFTHPEALLHVDGVPYASADRHHHTIYLPDAVRDGRPHRIELHGWTGLSGWPPDPSNPTMLQMGLCRVVEMHLPTRDFLSQAEVALELAQTMEDARPERHAILSALDRAFLALDTRDPLGEAFWDTVPAAHAALEAGLAAAGPPIDVTLHAIGHAHMDIAYLWPIDQIRQKNARTYSNVLRMMDQYPDYRFSHSQPQLYAYTEADRPEIFEAIRARVADGRWEPMGGMWVEPDTNLPGAEALVRQLMLGRRWFRERFGVGAETPVLWLPDTFGLSWCLPQLAVQAGLRWMCVNKASWNQYNQLPASTLWWEGIDGTRILTQFLTTPREVQHLPFPTNYKSDLTAAEVTGTWTASTAKERVRDLPIAFGYGDGGGGPTGELIRRARVWREMPGAPEVRLSTVRDCMEAIEAQAQTVPVWADELYLEGHRGTLTSQGWIKRANRKAEVALHDAEFLLAATGTEADLREAWERLCLNQFHDILPGTSVPEVFADARADYARIAEIVDEALARCRLPGGGLSVANCTPVGGPRLVTLPPGTAVAHAQDTPDGPLILMDCAPYSLTPPAPLPPPERLDCRLNATGAVLQNRHLRLELDARGRLTRLHDRDHDREVLAPGRIGNQLQAFEDRPLSWDAWDIDSFFEDRGEVVTGLVSMSLEEEGPLRAALRLEWQYRASTIRQRIMVYAGSRRVDFETEVDWQESHVLLKAAFPVNVFSPSATYEIQWGAIGRRTHRNTSWDYAKFEVPAQRWADLSESDWGVALLNDCKYGYDVRGDTMRLTLIKSATSPDPRADRGLHRFTYALLPHAGRWERAVGPEAWLLNDACRVVEGRGDGRAFVEADRPGAIVETVKPAEDGDGVVVRLYEGHRTRGRCVLRFGRAPRSVHRCDLLETADGEALEVEDGAVALDLRPFGIETLRVRF